tara:strand:+ start:77 stop:994 length:918 start_codon:yes stop_codon:yes gene_type:complete
MSRVCILTNDVETTSIWHNSLRDKTGVRVYKEGMPVLLDIYRKYNIKSTFFFTGYIAKLIPNIVRMILDDGHEVASHGMSHLRERGFDVMSLKDQIHDLRESKKILQDISGEKVISFRAPALRVNSNTAIALQETGYLIDSSVASQRFDMFMSFGGIKKLNWLTAPRLPYRTAENSLFNKGNGNIIEIPLSAALFPYVGTTMRIFPFLTKLQRNLLALETKISGKPIVFDVHPNEFIDESAEKREFDRRASNIFIGILQDSIRSKLKQKNLGIKGLKIYENQIKYFIDNKFQFNTIKEYYNNFKK